MRAKWLMCLIVAVAFSAAGVVSAQQQVLDSQSAIGQSQQPLQDSQQPGSYSELPPNQPNQPSATQSPDRSLLRNGQPQAAATGEAGQNETKLQAARGELGVWLVELNGPGVAIRRVTPGSAAEQAGLRPGDVLMQINERWLSSPQAAAEAIRAIDIGQPVNLQIWRDGQVQQISATIAPVRQQTIVTNREQPYAVGFRSNEQGGGELSQRIEQMERQIGTLTQELQQLRQQFSQMRPGGATGRGEIQTTSGIESRPADVMQPEATPLQSTTPPPGFEETGQKAGEPATEQPVQEATPPAAEPDSSTDNDLFK